VPQMQDQFHLLEEKREILEKELGAQKFIQVYKSIEVIVLDWYFPFFLYSFD
jgi:hypothetical protein